MLDQSDATDIRFDPDPEAESIETVVIGGGQAGLSVGYYLNRLGRPFVILDTNERTGDSWRRRWDSLLMFTPARLNGLPGMRFPAPGGSFVTKDQMADYLESYARRFDLPIRKGVRVDRVARARDRFEIKAGRHRFKADNVIVAMANYQVPRIPHYATSVDPGIIQLHSHDYRNPSQLQPGAVLVVGAGNSGADIAMEVARTHPTLMAGQETAHVPFRIETLVARHVLLRIVRFVGHRVLTVRTPIGRKVRPKFLTSGAPLVRVKPKDLVRAGIERVPRVVGVRGGLPVVLGERYLDVRNIIWCTGYRSRWSWIDLPVFGDRGEPEHDSGIVAAEPGLYFVGLHFLYAATSDTVTGMQRDAKRVAHHIATRDRARSHTPKAQALSAQVGGRK